MKQLFSTRDVHPRDRLTYWQDVACKTFVPLECRTGARPTFDATIWSASLADIGVALVETDDCDVERRGRHISATCDGEILLSLQLAGTCSLTQNARTVRLAAGDFAIYDTSRPYSLSVAQRTRQLVLKMPRKSVERRLGTVSRYLATAVRRADPLGGFASGFLELIPKRTAALEDMPALTAADLAQQVLDFTSLAVRHAAGGDIAAASASRTLALARLKSAIDHNLSDPGLRPAAAAAAAGIGVRYANALLAAEGSSLERYILDLRLCRAASMLQDPRQAGRAIGDIAYANGFDDPSHFGRAFKKRHGISPRDFRKCATSD